ncbi:MAG: protochlorophyllide oxidoreductase [Candidatus Dadabacteria bacterium]|nr:MAG: protochlorophyllide oxidoreductase [Candidatus Dadabacteria bacterium]
MSKSIRWTPEAEKRLKRAPFFVRPVIRKRAEEAARERNLDVVDEALLDELKSGAHKGDSPG